MKIDEKNIDELLIAYLLNELDDNAKKQVEIWIDRSEENKAQYQQISKLWQASEHSNLSFDTHEAWEKVSHRISRKSIFQNYWLRIAAAILLLLGSYAILKYINKPMATTVIYANNQLVNDTLSDGSVIKLNKGSKIIYDENFNSSIREITLEGEAFFEIERDTAKPFIINIENSRVEVLGTSFNINTDYDDNLVTVFVRSGMVRFSYLPPDTTKAFQSIELKAGEKVSYNKSTHELTESDDTLLNEIETYWIDQQLVFDGIRLEKVIAVLEAVYEVNIKLSDEKLKDCLLTVSFYNEDIDQVINVIAGTFNLEFEKDNNNYLLKGNACENQ